MSDKTGIAWTDATWSPILGCSPASAGCAQCYAVRDVWRMAHNPHPKIAAPRAGLVEKTPAGVLRWTGKVSQVDEQIYTPLQWKRPRRIFVANQSDLFHEGVDIDFIAQVFATMALAHWHTFQVLTKRPDRMRRLLNGDEDFWELVCSWINMDLEDEDCPVGPGRGWSGLERRSYDARATAPDPSAYHPLPNVWFGVSVENQAAAYDRIPALVETPAAVRFLSCEPLLGPVDLGPWLAADLGDRCRARLGLLHWVIVGAESGHQARPMDLAWVDSLLAQCRAAGARAFVKQVGRFPNPRRIPRPDFGRESYTLEAINIRDRKGGDMAEWPADLRVRELPTLTPGGTP